MKAFINQFDKEDIEILLGAVGFIGCLVSIVFGLPLMGDLIKNFL